MAVQNVFTGLKYFCLFATIKKKKNSTFPLVTKNVLSTYVQRILWGGPCSQGIGILVNKKNIPKQYKTGYAQGLSQWADNQGKISQRVADFIISELDFYNLNNSKYCTRIFSAMLKVQ